METLFLLKYGEIAIKGNNKKKFIRRLESNLRNACDGIKLGFRKTPGRFYLTCPGSDTERVRSVLEKTFGITWFAKALETDKEMAAIERAALAHADVSVRRLGGGCTFKIEARRSDKGFPLRSYDIACRLGDLVLEAHPALKVSLNHPDFKVCVEIRERTYVYGEEEKGPGGLPSGCAGKGLLLLSGGIDSPVAGYMVAKRGLSLDALYFHTPPYTSDESVKKVKELSRLLASYIPGMSLGIVPFTDAQLRIKEHGKEEEITLLTRASMMYVADRIAGERGGLCLVTGESLSQVASQTLRSIYFTGSFSNMPVFRPLVGFDKEEIVDLARRIGTFETSILPYADCCTLFAPRHPLIDPDFGRMKKSFEALGIEETLVDAAGRTSWTKA